MMMIMQVNIPDIENSSEREQGPRVSVFNNDDDDDDYDGGYGGGGDDGGGDESEQGPKTGQGQDTRRISLSGEFQPTGEIIQMPNKQQANKNINDGDVAL